MSSKRAKCIGSAIPALHRADQCRQIADRVSYFFPHLAYYPEIAEQLRSATGSALLDFHHHPLASACFSAGLCSTTRTNPAAVQATGLAAVCCVRRSGAALAFFRDDTAHSIRISARTHKRLNRIPIRSFLEYGIATRKSL
ncbi:hypothetical protein [Azoarcus olearius]|uniref:hypothetical protein n=1 Tax=Azoarcus sp. (strain BH72) TaxID=418699 RepID=UPI0011D19D6A|nr:hypothetical protein [Azoarcus olearius]